MRHLASRLILLLAIGAILNLAVAWAFAIWCGSVVYDAQLTASWAKRLQQEGKSLDQALRGPGLDLVFIRQEQPEPYIHLYRAGWPLRAMEGEAWRATTGNMQFSSAVGVFWGVDLHAERVRGAAKVRTTSSQRILPLRPAWLGFLGNTVLYAVVAMGMIACASLVRRTYRGWRGRCAACGYDLRGDLERGCPECGHKRAEAVANGSAAARQRES